jgi:predicted RNase H-like HicB family nuclease
MKYYPAIFIPHQDGRFDVYFPDLPGLVSQGDDMGHAIARAQEGLSLHLGSMIEDDDPVPAPSTIREALARHAEFSSEEGDAGTPVEEVLCQFVPYIPLPKEEKAAPMRLSITLKPSVVGNIDAMAEEMGLTRSGLIAVATRDYISRMRG